MKPFLKSAWEECSKLRDEGYRLHAEGEKLVIEGRELFKECVLDYYEPDAVIDWGTGEVEGEILPIPVGELR